jgi:uncharacterized membrane protein
MHRAILCIVSLLFLVTEAAAQNGKPSDLKGLWLITDYPSVAARPGESATFKLKLQNANLPPEQVALSVSGLPQGWKAEFRGGGQPVGAAMAATNESVSIELRIEAPEGDAKAVDFTVRADGATQKAALPLKLMLTGDVAPKLGLKTKLPSLKGTPKSSFDYNFTVANDSGRNLLVSLAADVPSNFQTTFTEGYGSQELSSIPIEAGQTKDLKVKVQPPSTVAAGKYDLKVRAMAEGVSAEAPLGMEITGQPKLRLSAADGRLSGSAEVGDTAQYNLVVANDGTAPLEELELSSSPPTDWKIEFQPKSIPRLDAGQSREVQAMVTPSAKAIAGDYMTTFRANAKGESGSVDFRVSVKTSTMWGIVGLAVIAVALLVLLGAVARFGRR